MKRTVIASILTGAATLFSASLAYADTGSSASARNMPVMKVMESRSGGTETKDLRARIASSTSAIRTKIASTTADIRNKLRDGIEIRKENRYAEMLKRYQQTIDRETEILDKVNSRIGKMKEEAEDTGAAEKLAADAKTQLDNAADSLADLARMSDALPALPVSSTTAEEWRDDLASMRKVGAEIDAYLKAAKSDLQRSVDALRVALHPSPASNAD
jgi:transcriptional regulator of heat shock response